MECIIAAWIIVGVLHAGFLVARFQARYPLIARETIWSDRALSYSFGIIAGPINIPTSLICGLWWNDDVFEVYRHGWKL